MADEEFPQNRSYRLLDSREIGGRTVDVWSSPELADPAWDDFLEQTPLGHFQQSSRWASAKRAGGWEPIRIVATIGDRIIGGFQALTHRTPLGRIGYVYKGPVCVPEDPALIRLIIELFHSALKQHRLIAAIVQPPDESAIGAALMADRRFMENRLVDVIGATLLVDLSPGIEAISRRMRRSTWNEVNQAKRKGIGIREGSEADADVFFRLMSATCNRQRTRPEPATPSGIRKVLTAFQPGHVRLTFAEFNGNPIAGLMCLCFGDRLTIWKKGWSGEHRDKHPSQLLMFDAVDWGCRAGYKWADFAALNPGIAAALLRGNPLSGEQQRTRDFVHLSLGDRPLILPASRLLIPNPAARLLYRAARSSGLLKGIRLISK
jgi:peptidoglycan pentaglycine glycine transferase (the first glycine)